VNLGGFRSLYRELTPARDPGKPLVVGGPPALVQALQRALGVGPGDARNAAVYVHIWAGDGHDEEQLKRARRARVPTVALAPEDLETVPYVLATDVVPLHPGEGFPIGALARVIAARLGDDGAALASRVPVLRRAVAQRLIENAARKNGVIAAAVFVPGVDLPVLLRNELKLVSQLEQIHGRQIAPGNRLPELAGTAAFGLGLRAVARELLDLVPVAGWAIKGAVAYAGTRALGEAALRRLESLGEEAGSAGGKAAVARP
jgi:uncharacterized protein (DUF697 family)